MAIQHEKPELEQKKTNLLREQEDCKIKLADLEDSLLEVEFLFTSCGKVSSRL